ncbi:helix-turn-helix transcriptional regulator [Clostridium butyricum]|uniref:helix-turn-helix transcriptional regulator n=1 Tax=Clostridium butyricum TaxID=1492 RepID=UPI0022E71F95|nr:helix-turn-helix transcriptional regulator [Clostridium butyricum]MDU3597545.1 helix-turn-helix transcriptional regulator [Clostridium butyricum]
MSGKTFSRNKLYDIRKQKKLKRVDVAVLIEKSIVFIEGIETGKREPKITEAKKLAEIYNVTLDEIFSAIKSKSEKLKDVH